MGSINFFSSNTCSGIGGSGGQPDYIPETYSQSWIQASIDLEPLIEVNDIVTSKGWRSVWDSQFTISNTSNDELLGLVIYDDEIKVLDIEIEPQNAQRYELGISTKTRIFVSGQFSASVYIQGL